MNRTLLLLLVAGVITTACKGRSSDLRRDQQSYEVVQEGAASGVAATLNAPGEPAPGLPSMTGTNADTTSAFTLPGGMTTTDQSGGTLAGTLPANAGGGAPYGYPSDAPVRRPRPAPVPQPVVTNPEPSPAPATDPVAAPAPAPTTETAAPQEPAPASPPESEDPETEDPPPPTSTDTGGTTDTSGQSHISS